MKIEEAYVDYVDTYRVCKHRKEFLIFKLQGENSICLLILRYFSNLDKSTIQHRPSDLSEYKDLMLIFQIEVKYEFVSKIIKSSGQKFVKCSKLKFFGDICHFSSFWIFYFANK